MLSFDFGQAFYLASLPPKANDKEDRSSESGKLLKEIYECQCGKQYLSFPATYLHFRAKHNIKLSTKPS